MNDAADGWTPLRTAGFPGLVGPYLGRREGDGEGAGWVYGFTAEARHLNVGGVVHGGALIAFADETLGMTLWEAADRRPVTTVQLNTHFLAPVREGDFVTLRAELLRRTRSLLFVRGLLRVADRTVASLDGVWKILGER
jgi:uncharacterized protein (TIGR00369 family)